MKPLQGAPAAPDRETRRTGPRTLPGEARTSYWPVLVSRKPRCPNAIRCTVADALNTKSVSLIASSGCAVGYISTVCVPLDSCGVPLLGRKR